MRFLLLLSALFHLFPLVGKAQVDLSPSIYTPPQPYGYGGERLVREFINREMVYPEKAIAEGTQGTVAIFFIADTSGAIRDVKIVNSVSPEIDKEALRLFHKLEWTPAIYAGITKASEHIYRFKFNIRKYRRACKKRGYEQFPLYHPSIDTSNKVYHFSTLEKQPFTVYKGANYPFGKYVLENLEYPEEAFRNYITGTVKLEFVVEPSGNISNIRVLSHVGGGCTDEAIRLLTSIGWKAGIHNEMAVRTRMTTEITFTLNNDQHRQYVPSSAKGAIH